jgi:histidinol-phosphate aminotransferase
VDPDRIERAIGPRTKLVFLATPNNPTGTSLPEPTLFRLLETGLLVVLDEAYVEFSPWPSFAGWVERFPNLVVLRTFSKWAGLAGLRIGYGVFPPPLAHHLLKVKPPFNVNLAAEVAVRATLEDLPRVERGVRRIVRERALMARGLSEVRGLRVWPSDANFLLVQPEGLDPAPLPGSPLNEALVARGIAVRSYRHPRLANAVRISLGLPSHTDAVVAALHDWREFRGG